MMEWRDEGIVLSVRAHGETAAILEVLTRAHGRHLGVVHGGQSRKKAAMLQPGNQVSVAWRARLDAHLGTWAQVEAVRSRMGLVLSDPLRLQALSSVCALAGAILPEREVLAAFQDRTVALCDAIAAGEGWLRDYVFWEMALLVEGGLPLDLSACAVAGGANDLTYISPRTGRAVSRAGAGDWADRLLPLPELLLGAPATLDGVVASMEVTGHFLGKVAAGLGDRPLPAARMRFLDALRREVSQ